jgi:hypothetical protein
VDAGTLAEQAVVEPGLGLIVRASVVTAGAHVGYRRFAGVDVGVATLQADTALTSEVALIAMAHHERPDVFPNVWRAGVGMRARAQENLIVDLGVGFDRQGDETVFGGDHSDPCMGVTWRLPWALGDQRLAIFLERRISTVDVVGLRLERGPTPWSRLR